MIEIIDNTLVYVTVDEIDTIKKLKRVKEPSGTYFQKGEKVAFSWFLKKPTIDKLGLGCFSITNK